MSDTENNVSVCQNEPMEGSENTKAEEKGGAVTDNGDGDQVDQQELGGGDNPDKSKKSSPKIEKSPRKSKKKKVEEQKDEEEEDEDGEEETRLGLLEQPTILEAGRKRERKKVERIEMKITTPAKDKPKVEVEEGSGEKLGDIPRIEFKIGRLLADDLKPLHRFMYGRVGSTHEIKRNIRKFSGFTFDKESSEFEKKQQQLNRMPMTMIKMFCETLDLERSGLKEKVIERLLDFLLKPKSSGKALPKKRKRSSTGGKDKKKRKPRTKKDKSEKSQSPKKSKKSKEEVDDDSEAGDEDEEEDASVSDDEDDAEAASDKEEEEEESQEDDAEDSDSDVAPKKKKARTESPKKAVTKKSPKPKPTPKKEAKKEKETKKPAKQEIKKKTSPKKTSEKKPKKKAVIESSNDEDDSSDDEPLVPKKKAPTDEELRDVIKKILDHANLEEVTMKTVCKQVYAKYPDFDLTSRKDFIKTTVKQIIR